MQSLFGWGKIFPYAWVGALDESPLMLEGGFQTSIGCQWVLARHPGKQLHQVCPPFDPLIDSFIFFTWLPMKPPR